MNRRVLTALAFSFLTVWALQYFTKKPQPSGVVGAGDKIQAGQVYRTPVQQCWHREPKREVDFIDTKVSPDQESIVVLQTPQVKVEFSNFGGVVRALSFKKHKGRSGRPIETVLYDTVEQREEACFLLALDEKTPFNYKFVSQTDRSVSYETKAGDWRIRKTYLLHDDSYKLDLTLDFEPLIGNPTPINTRLFYPAPHVSEIADNTINGLVTRDAGAISKIASSEELVSVWGLPEIFGVEDKYFIHTLAKDASNFALGGYLKRVNKRLVAILEGAEVKAEKRVELSFYMGPKLLSDLEAVDGRLADVLSFGWLSWLCKILLRLLEFLYKHLGNFGLAIVVLTILLKLPFLPLSIVSRRKMEEYQKYQPTINRIRSKFRHDSKKQQEEILRFHQEHKLSPATPMVGCLPMFVQLPILFSLYRVLSNYLSLYQAPLFGWINDLSAADPYYVLPVLMGATMLWQQTVSPVADQKQRMMMMFMPIVMTAIFVNFPAGLVLYWLMNNVLTVGEDLLRKRLFK
ncbi:membrane protein insertase YidC [Candidatus Dependentiae bacterium]|nr:membrane protein insertase YidC [Candidatus Dependentiae bacterium]